jgi:hypothetical protein
MASIDQYKQKHLGDGNQTRKIAIYELLEDVASDEKDFDGKVGDIIVGGGSGEAPAFRISMPETIYFFARKDWDDFETHADLFKVFWTPTQSYNFCEGFSKMGWTPNSPIEFWLAENICLLLIDNVEHFSIYKTSSISKSILQFFKTY